jgi:hypothetical protein
MEGISDKESRLKPKKAYNRLLPEEGIDIIKVKDGIEYKLHYMDINDVPLPLKESMRAIVRAEIAAESFVRYNRSWEGSDVKRAFRVYSFIDSKVLSVLTFTEVMNSMWGYGRDDFYLETYSIPEFRHTDFDLWPVEDIGYVLRKTGIMKKMYSQIIVEDEKFGGNIDSTVLGRNDCMPGPQRKIDEKWSHITVTKIIDIPNGRKAAVLDYDGEVYLKQNLRPEGFEELDIHIEKAKAIIKE